MKYLLDTCAALWFNSDSEKLSARELTIIKDEENEIFFSLASLWEVQIKHSLGKLSVNPRSFCNDCVSQQFIPLELKKEHFFRLDDLKRKKGTPVHKDPFDKLIMAQAVYENMTIITHDEKFGYYEGIEIV